MGEKPSGGEQREPNLELPPLRLPGRRRKTSPEPTASTAAAPTPGAQPAPPKPRTPRRARRLRAAPALPIALAAAMSGLVVGAAGTGTTYGGLRGCEAMNGAPSCGAPGLGYLAAIAIGMVALGALLLKLLRAPEPLGTSALGVGILLVVVLAGLTAVIFSAWMFLVVPLVSAAAYTGAQWVTTRFAEPEPPPGPDVR